MTNNHSTIEAENAGTISEESFEILANKKIVEMIKIVRSYLSQLVDDVTAVCYLYIYIYNSY